MTRRWLGGALILLAVAGCGDDGGSETAAETSTTVGQPSSTDPGDGTCAGDDYPPFGTTWLPDEWADQYLIPGSGGSDEENCGVYHWGGDGRYVDVRAGDGGLSFGQGESRTITVLGRPAEIGPIHEGWKVQTETHALLGYGIDEDVLEQLSTGLFHAGSAAPEATDEPVPDGVHVGQVVEVGPDSVVVDLIGWFYGDEANRVAAERGETEIPVPNDHYTVNDDPTVHTLEIGAVVVTSPWAEYGSDGCELCQRVITYDRLVELFAEPEPEPPEANVRHDPFWVVVVGGVVTRLDEQYIP